MWITFHREVNLKFKGENMSYTALYRKFRPLNFNEMVGQEHITDTIRKQIIAGRVGHAYLFNGGRGTRENICCKNFGKSS